MTDGYERITDELRRLDDQLAVAVTLPAVDAVIRRAGTLNRTNTAPAAAVLTVGALSATTAIAQITVPAPAIHTAAAVSPGRAPVTSADSDASLPVVEQAPAQVGGVPRDPETRVDEPLPPRDPGPAVPPPPLAPPPPVLTTTAVAPPPTTTTRNNDDDNDDDRPTRPSKPNKPTKPPEPTKPDPTKPTDEPSDPPDEPSDPPDDPPDEPSDPPSEPGDGDDKKSSS